VLLAGAALAIAWTAGALIQDRRQGFRIAQQVPSSVFQIRDWAHQLPSGASVRVDIPPSGVQLWAVYMLASHPVDSPEPVLHTTYAYAPYGLRAAYSLSYRYHVGPSPVRRRYPVPPYAVNPPVFENHVFVLRRIAWPTARSGYPETASRRLVEP
jgi:hypothetical protein